MPGQTPPDCLICLAALRAKTMLSGRCSLSSCGRGPILINILTVITLLLLVFFSTDSKKSQSIQLDMMKDELDKMRSSFQQEFSRPRLAVHARSGYYGYMERVLSVFSLLGYKHVGPWSSNSPTDWDVLWSVQWPFHKLGKDSTEKLAPHQIINSMPGSSYVTKKTSFVKINVTGIPPAFFLPQDTDRLIEYASGHPNKMFVKKGESHRQISLQALDEILNGNANKTFVQEFISNPLLIDGHKFEFGVYTFIPSLNPLRIYVYGDIQVRFCKNPYNIVNATDDTAYIVKGSDYLPIWKVESFRKIYNELGFSKQSSLEHYLNSKFGKDTSSSMWKQVDRIISQVYSRRQREMITSQRYYASNKGYNFNELVRFDFLLDENINVHVMEANFSPNLDDSDVPENKNLFEQVVFNMLSLRGITSRTKVNHIHAAQVADKDILVNPTVCLSQSCLASCSSPSCSLCSSCLAPREKWVLKEAWLENSRKHLARRIFPSGATNYGSSLPPLDQKQAKWFREKCRENRNWCA